MKILIISNILSLIIGWISCYLYQPFKRDYSQFYTIGYREGYKDGYNFCKKLKEEIK